MQRFYGIIPGQTRQFDGLKVSLSEDGEFVWMGCKRLDLAECHGVVVLAPGDRVSFQKANGQKLLLGDFPAWVVRGKERKNKSVAAMFNIEQFEGGLINLHHRTDRCLDPSHLTYQ